MPARRALTATLRDALDPFHQTINAVTVTVKRLEDIGVSVPQTVVAVILVLAGVTTFLLVPLAFITRNFSIFLGVLNAILMGMLLGLAAMAAALAPYAEGSVLAAVLALIRFDRPMRTVVRKNLSGHRSRNSLTSLMVVLSIAFLLFIGAMFALQGASIQTNVRLFLGADIVAFAPLVQDNPGGATEVGNSNANTQTARVKQLNEPAARAYLDAVSRTREIDGVVLPPLVESYSFVTFSLSQLQAVRTVRVTNLASLPRPRTLFYGVERNYLRTAYDQYAVVRGVAPS